MHRRRGSPRPRSRWCVLRASACRQRKPVRSNRIHRPPAGAAWPRTARGHAGSRRSRRAPSPAHRSRLRSPTAGGRRTGSPARRPRSRPSVRRSWRGRRRPAAPRRARGSTTPSRGCPWPRTAPGAPRSRGRAARPRPPIRAADRRGSRRGPGHTGCCDRCWRSPSAEPRSPGPTAWPPSRSHRRAPAGPVRSRWPRSPRATSSRRNADLRSPARDATPRSPRRRRSYCRCWHPRSRRCATAGARNRRGAARRDTSRTRPGPARAGLRPSTPWRPRRGPTGRCGHRRTTGSHRWIPGWPRSTARFGEYRRASGHRPPPERQVTAPLTARSQQPACGSTSRRSCRSRD